MGITFLLHLAALTAFLYLACFLLIIYTEIMERKQLTKIFMFIGLFLGGYTPALWGASTFSFSGLIFSALGGILGIWLAFKLTQ